MGHHTNSPSVFFRRKLCPGSKRMETQFPNTDNEHSLRGSAVHKVGELCLLEGKTPGYWLNQPIEVPKVDGTMHTHIFNAEDNEALWPYINYVWTRKEQMGPDTVMRVEQKVRPSIWLGRDDVDGTVDCSLESPNEIELIDYKNGAGVAVEVENNSQLIQYAIGVLAQVDWQTTPHDIPVKLTVVQPRCPHPQGPIRSWTMPATHFFGLVEEHKAAAAATDDPDAPLVPGEIQCRFCKAKGSCPAVAQAAMDAFTPCDAEPTYLPPAAHTGWEKVEASLGQPAEVLQPQQIATILDKVPMIEAWLKGVRDHALSLAKDGTSIPGYKLVRGRSNRKWSLDDEEMIKKLASLRDRDKKAIGQKDACTIKPLSIAQAEKSLKPRVTDRVWKNVEKLVIKPEGPPTLAPLTDPRQAIVTAETAFEPVTAENPFG